MKIFRKRLVTAVAAVAIMTILLPASVQAWELKGESTAVNEIKTKDPSSLITTIQTNFHAFGCTGFVVLTPSKTIDSILGITELQQQAQGRGVIYIANTTCGDRAAAVFQAEADKIGGEILWYFDIQMFKFADEWYQQQTVLSSPIKMAIGILESDRSSSYDYGMIRLHEGVATFLPDSDSDEYTITFESNRFSTYAMVRYPKETATSTEAAKQTGTSSQTATTQQTDTGTSAQTQTNQSQTTQSQTGTQSQTTARPGAGTQSTAASATDKEDEWDDVPPTGDFTLTISFVSILSGVAISSEK